MWRAQHLTNQLIWIINVLEVKSLVIVPRAFKSGFYLFWLELGKFFAFQFSGVNGDEDVFYGIISLERKFWSSLPWRGLRLIYLEQTLLKKCVRGIKMNA